jgi:hypothetical protein
MNVDTVAQFEPAIRSDPPGRRRLGVKEAELAEQGLHSLDLFVPRITRTSRAASPGMI